MNKEFVEYKEALALKELGFDEPCLAIIWENEYIVHITDTRPDENTKMKWCETPLYQQAFRWFRENHDMHHGIGFNGSWYYDIDSMKNTDNAVYEVAHKWDMKTYEEAEFECLKKLIEIAKTK